MARLARDGDPNGPLVRGFANDGFVVDGRVYRGLFLTPNSAFEWSPPAVADLAVSHLEQVLGLQPAPEFVLLGTGPGLTFPPRALIRTLEERGIGLEVMDSRAAARTWGVLRSEERWIVAALMPLA